MKTIKLAILLAASFALAAGRATAVTIETNVNSNIPLRGTPGVEGSLYQWFKNTAPLQDDVVHILGAQSYILFIKAAVPNDSGTYTLYVTDPGITNARPTDVFVLWVDSGYITKDAGKSLQLAGQPVANASYQWLKGDVPLDSESNPSATNATLVISSTSTNDTGRYVLKASIVTNGVTVVEIEAVYFVTVVEPVSPPHITSFVLLTTGNDITFSVTTRGSQLTYQWFWQRQPIPGATEPTLEYHNAFLTAPAGYYSVIVSNAAGQVSSPPPGLLFTKTVPSGNYEGILYDPNGIAVDSSGYFQMNVSGKKHRFSGTATLGPRTLRFTGEFGDDHHSDVKLSDGTQIHLQLIATNDTAEVNGTVDTGNSNLSLLGFQEFYTSQNPFPAAGKYTLSLLDTNLHALARLQPDGVGYAVLTVSPSGRVKMAGCLADGTPFSQTRGLSQADAFPLYVSLYGGQGVVIGWLQFAGSSESSIQGYSLYWIGYSAPYTFGNTSALLAQGSTYTPLSPGDLALPFTEGVATFTGGDLYTADDANGLTKIWDFSKVQYSASTRAFKQPGFGFHGSAPESVSLKIIPGNGQISGSFIDPITGQQALIKGVLLQEQGSALGYFLNANGSGYFALEPVQP